MGLFARLTWIGLRPDIAELSPHAHFKCIKSGKIYDVQIDEDTLSRMHSLVPEGFEAENIDLCFSGIRKTVSN